MANQNPFKGVAIDLEKVPAALESVGMVNIKTQDINDKLIQYAGTFEGKDFLLKVFPTKDGKCTLGKGTGNDDTHFATIASHVVEACRYAAAARLEMSLTRFEADKLPPFVEHLQGLNATIERDEANGVRRLIRFLGPRGDTLTVNVFGNGTLQLQGTHAQVAGWAVDFLQAVLPLDEMLEQQRAVYALPVTVKQIKSELVGRIPYAHDRLVDEVRGQLSSALALTKVGIEMEDYAALAFPALRGLEGVCIQLLRDECGLNPTQRAELGLYFEKSAAGFALAPPYNLNVGATQQSVAAECYAAWNQQRHRLFHMDGTLETTSIIEERTDAVAIVDDVLALVDRCYQRLSKTSP